MKKHKILKRALSLLLAVALAVSYLPIIRQASAANAVTGSIGNAYGEIGNKYADPHTLNNWKLFFGVDDPNNLNTAYAGGVWTDKSVFNSVAEYLAATDENDSNIPLTLTDDNHFLVALSAIAATKSVEGYSSLPTDTVLVLDLSASMVSNQAVNTLVSSANDAITRLQNLNANNRVAVIAYSGNSSAGYSGTNTAEVILPLGRYTPGLNGSNQSAYLVSSWVTGSGRNRVNHTGVKVANGVTGTIAEGVTSTFSVSNAKDAAGGTYIQNGLYQAWEIFEDVEHTRIQDGIQAGIGRVPVIVLMSDGAATTATTNYTNVGASDTGNGTASYATNGVAFMTQLTASWVRDKVAEKYGETPLFYTLGLNVGSNEAAKNLLDPANNTGTDSMWSTFRNLANRDNKTMQVSVSNDSTANITYTAPVGDSWDESYVTKYFPASNAAALGTAFSDIVQQIIFQSLYYPTMVEGGNSINEDGFLVFNDYIGNNMEVKAIKGIQLGSTLYTGQTLAKMIYQGGMGTVENPTDAGNNLVWSVQKRLGLSSVQATRDLLSQAYNAGQLFYDPETGEFSNYIGWYADENEQFVAFWDGNDDSPEAVPENLRGTVKYAIKSYCFYDAVGEGHRKTDMMYATIQVRTTLRTTAGNAAQVGDTQVIGKLPASLIPLVEYDVQLNGTNVMTPVSLTATGATAPSRLLYEVGLDSDIDLLDIAGTAPNALTVEDGKYVFYTNQWHSRDNFSYATNKNTLSYFEPSYENERYFYNYDTPIYVDTNGTLYTGAAAPTYSDSNTYYHRFITYYKENGVVRAQYDYEPISEHVLTGTGDHDHLTRLEDNTWVVNRGTLHHYFADYQIDKLENTTGTLDVSFMPFTHDLEVSATTDHFHVDFYLGNNGKLTLTPTAGIKLSKIADDTLTDKTTDYRFTVTTDNAYNGTVRLVKEDAQGNRTESSLAFTDGVATLDLKHGQSAWILDSTMVGKTFTITEAQGAGYVVASVNGVATDSSASLTVAANTVHTALFVNTKQSTGSVTIGKSVISSLAQHQDKEFSFTVNLSGENLIETREYQATRSDGTVFNLLPNVNNTVTLKHNQYLVISGLPVDTIVAATEADYSDVGFTVNQATLSTLVAADTAKYLNFSNTYAADPVTNGSTVQVEVTKHLVSDTPLTATFNFKLERYIYADGSYELESQKNVSYSGEQGDKTVAMDFANETYSAVGTYYYRITEVRDEALANAGIVFDAVPAFFTVEVSDSGEGNLYISNVTAGTDAAVIGNANDGWTVTAAFTNTYAVDGAAKVVVNIQKKISGDYGVLIPPAGFSFDLYEASYDEEQGRFSITNDTPIATSAVTGAGGLTDIPLVFDDPAADIGTHYYVLEEHVPAQGERVPGVSYSPYSIGLKVVVGHEDGHFTVSATTYSLRFSPAHELATYVGQGTEGVVSAETVPLVFTNTYTPDPVSLEIPGTKTLNGKDSEETFRFTLSDGNSTENAYTSDHTDGVPQNFSFRKSWRYTGTYVYTLRENIPAEAVNNVYHGVTYDDSVYTVTVTVTGDNLTGKLHATYVIEKDGQVVPGIEFVNTYTADPASVTVSVTKNLLGGIRNLQANAFKFQLVDAEGTVVETVGNGIPTAQNSAPVTFTDLTFTTPGTYYYTVREVMPDGANAENNYTYHGVKYDNHSAQVEIVVTDNGSGQLVATVNYTDSTFNNEYSVSPTSFTIQGKKEFTGDDLANHDFQFVLYEAYWDSDSQSVVPYPFFSEVTSCDDDGYFSFYVGPFRQTGAYRYILQEQIPDDADPLMHYDASYYVIEIDVTDNLMGGLTADANIVKVLSNGETMTVSPSGIFFHNVYDAEPVSVDLDGVKQFNLNLPDNTFSFELYQALTDANGDIYAIGDPILTAWNQGYSFRFEEMPIVDQLSGTTIMSNYLTFSQAGTYHFVVKENIPEEADANGVYMGVTYDETVYKITIEVTESDVNGRATLDYTMTVNGEAGGQLLFTNSYAATTDDTVTISGKKYLSGRDLRDNEFKFGLYKAIIDDEGYVTVGELIEEVANVGEDFTFSPISFPEQTDSEIYLYVVKEILPEGADENGVLGEITYDRRMYVVGVIVEDNDDGTLSVYDPIVIPVQEDGRVADNTTEEIFFRNVYTEAPPETGDNSHPVFWAVMLGMSLLAMGAVLVIDKKKRA